MEEESSGKDYVVVEVAANEEVMEVAANEEVTEENDHAGESNTRQDLWTYLKSADFIEILCCVVCGGLLGVLSSFPGVTLNIRPIPYQYLENAQDYVLNLSLDNEFSGDTVPSEALVVIAVFVPLLIQL